MTPTLKISAALLVLGLATPALADRPAARQIRQQERIAQGVASGELTARETIRLERQEARLHRQIRRDRADGGGLSPAERARIEAKQDRLSRRIYVQKHDAQSR
jgi:hypothetical protein